MSPDAGIEGQVVAVVGGTRGIGAAISQRLAEAGAVVVIAGRDLLAAESLAAEINRSGGQATGAGCDVTDSDDCVRLIESIEQRHGRLDTLFANQGIAGPSLRLTEWSDDAIANCLDVNLVGCVHLARAAQSLLEAEGGGRLIITGSGSGQANAPGLGMYGISKAAVSHLVRQLAIEWRSRSIAVNELIPGPVRTAMTGFADDARDESNPMEEFAKRQREWLKDPDDVVPLARLLAEMPTNGPTGQQFSLAGRVL